MNSTMGNGIMMQAFGAMMRGESPRTFLSNLAKNNPAMQGLDFNDLEKTAQEVCNQKGVNMEDAKSKVVEFANSHIK